MADEAGIYSSDEEAWAREAVVRLAMAELEHGAAGQLELAMDSATEAVTKVLKRFGSGRRGRVDGGEAA